MKQFFVLIQSPDETPIAYVVEGKQFFALPNVEKWLSEVEVQVLRDNGFTVEILKEAERPDGAKGLS